jgi:hypothetical protein
MAAPFDPKESAPMCGCPGINRGCANSRESLVGLYREAIHLYGGCGFVAWDRGKAVAYHTFLFVRNGAKNDILRPWRGFGVRARDAWSICCPHHRAVRISAQRAYARALCRNRSLWASSRDFKKFMVQRRCPTVRRAGGRNKKAAFLSWNAVRLSIRERIRGRRSDAAISTGRRRAFSLSLPLDVRVDPAQPHPALGR